MRKDSKVIQNAKSQSNSDLINLGVVGADTDTEDVAKIIKSFFEVYEEETADAVDDAISEAIVSIVCVNEAAAEYVTELLRLQKLIRTVSNRLYRPHTQQ
jgi:hypothetical protein